LVVVAMVAGWWVVVRPIQAEQGWTRMPFTFAPCGARSSGADGCVVDGDTLIIGFGPERRRIRLTGYDAPELDGACEAERKLALASRDALANWLAQGRIEWDGADEPPRDQYGRELRALSRVERDGTRELLADAMIVRGLAVETGWGAAPGDWCG
jgi:endonuclease YncB( thermonuclease family)